MNMRVASGPTHAGNNAEKDAERSGGCATSVRSDAMPFRRMRAGDQSIGPTYRVRPGPGARQSGRPIAVASCMVLFCLRAVSFGVTNIAAI
jgi:hypothetical protein